MKKTTHHLVLAICALGLACLALEGQAATSGAVRNTFQLQVNSAMKGGGSRSGPQGWATSSFAQSSGSTNQALQLRFQGLGNNQIYHLMASVGTNGEPMHVADFMPDQTGVIEMQFMDGMTNGMVESNSMGSAGSMMDGWEQMSWVMYPVNGTNWCNAMNGQGEAPRSMNQALVSGSGMSGSGGLGGMGGTGGMSGSGGMGGSGWPAMTNWVAGTSNWWPAMAEWCWDYTNLLNGAAGEGGAFTNWWGSLGSSTNHLMPLPRSLRRVPAVNGLVILDENLNPVLATDLANSDSFWFQTQSAFTNRGIVPGAKATLEASATHRSSSFALTATGLAPKTSYTIAINGANVAAMKTDARGQLQLRQLPGGSTGMKNISSISILNSKNKVVLSATLPPG